MDVLWTRANLMEVLPELPSPQTLSVLIPLLDRASREHWGRILAPDDELGPMFKVFFGRPYTNISQAARMGGFARISAAAILRDLGHTGELPVQADKPFRPTLLQFVVAIPTLVRLLMQRLLLPLLLKRSYAAIDREVRRFRSADPSELPDKEIWQAIQRWNELTPRFIKRNLIVVSTVTSEVVRPLEVLCRWIGFQVHRLVGPQLAGGARTVSGRAAYDLIALAGAARSDARVRAYFERGDSADGYREALAGTDFLDEFEGYLERYGHRGPYESDLALPRYSEEPAQLLHSIRNQVMDDRWRNPEEIEKAQCAAARRSWADFKAGVRWWLRPLVLPIVRVILARGKRLYAHRERTRSELVRVGAELRRWALVLAERFESRGWLNERDDFAFLEPGEISAVLEDAHGAPSLKDEVTARKRQHAEWARIEMPLVIVGDTFEPKTMGEPITAKPGVLRGDCISPGAMQGEVVVMQVPTDYERMKPGAILVAPATDPAWTPIFTQAAGVVVEVGGQISHASIVARELGLPALANVAGATKLLRDGDVIRLDATNEMIEIVREPKS